MHLSVVVCAYDMERELPRTIYTLGAANQREMQASDYEIIVLDNGSPQPVDEARLREITPNLRVVRHSPAQSSPVAAINAAMQMARGNLLGLLIDGARMVSPCLLRRACEAHSIDSSKVIGTLGFHLGPDEQMRSGAAGYDEAIEDELLAATPWEEDGYSLFDISVLAASSREGWFGCIVESNAAFFSRTLWDHLQGLDERFVSPGGGMVNPDFWRRAVRASDHQPWILLGEGTFHQVHGGAATSGTPFDRQSMFAEYRRVLGKPFARPRYSPRFVGTIGKKLAKAFMGTSPMPVRRTRSVRQRRFKVGIPPGLLDTIQAATLKTEYKQLRLAKNPFDLALYLRVLQRLAPRTIIEIGSSEGGSALWFRDQCRVLGLATSVVSIDLSPPAIEADGISFVAANSTRPFETFPTEMLADALHPWLVIEDSAHTRESVSAVLGYFDGLLQPGDYIVVEDGVVTDLRDDSYRKYDDGPNTAVAEFLCKQGTRYRIDSETCDFYGPNVTYCPNAWLVRQ